MPSMHEKASFAHANTLRMTHFCVFFRVSTEKMPLWPTEPDVQVFIFCFYSNLLVTRIGFRGRKEGFSSRPAFSKVQLAIAKLPIVDAYVFRRYNAVPTFLRNIFACTSAHMKAIAT